MICIYVGSPGEQKAYEEMLTCINNRREELGFRVLVDSNQIKSNNVYFRQHGPYHEAREKIKTKYPIIVNTKYQKY